jgi:hypothetical protein
MANLAEVVNKHLGVMVRWPELTEVSLASAIASVLGDPTFEVDMYTVKKSYRFSRPQPGCH